MNYYINPAGRPFETNKKIPGLEEITLEEYRIACQEWNDINAPPEPPPGPTFAEQVQAVVLQMIEDGIVKEGSEYEPPED